MDRGKITRYYVVADAMRDVYDCPGTFTDALMPFAMRFGFRRGGGLTLLRWLLDLVGDPQATRWMDEARDHVDRAAKEGSSPRIPAQ